MKRVCLNCNKEFNSPPCKIKVGKGLYCSMKCLSEHRSIIVKCLVCKKEFRVTKSRYAYGRGVFCSKECNNRYTPKQTIVVCDYCGKKFKARDSELKRGVGIYCSKKCSYVGRKKYNGKLSSNWKGGKQRDRHNGDYRYSDWRLKVYERDNFTCQECGKKGGKLNAHHQFTWAKYPSLRFELWNGITLCEQCHKKEHSKNKEVLNGKY